MATFPGDPYITACVSRHETVNFQNNKLLNGLWAIWETFSRRAVVGEHTVLIFCRILYMIARYDYINR